MTQQSTCLKVCIFILCGTFTGIMLIGTTGLLAAQSPAKNPSAACSSRHLAESATVGQFAFKSYKSEDEGSCLQVLHAGKIVFRRTNDSWAGYTLGQPEDKNDHVPAITNGTDITGRGHPDMIVSSYTGGAHCCLFHYVFELEPEFKLLATLDAENSDLSHFAKFDGDQRFYYLTNDWSFAYWRESFAASPAPDVILRFVNDAKGGGYHLALDKMQKPEPKAKEWQTETQDAKDAFVNNPSGDGIGSKLWGNMLDLIYTGHAGLAWKLFDDAWPTQKPGKDAFLSDFCSQLESSRYWPDLASALKSAPPTCVHAKPGQDRR